MNLTSSANIYFDLSTLAIEPQNSFWKKNSRLYIFKSYFLL